MIRAFTRYVCILVVCRFFFSVALLFVVVVLVLFLWISPFFSDALYGGLVSKDLITLAILVSLFWELGLEEY